jgi:hypothetical protein
MAATAREAIRELMAQAMATLDVLLEAADPELSKSSSHACAQGKDVWILITNDIDHERIHTGQVPEGRYESRRTASPMELLIADPKFPPAVAGKYADWRRKALVWPTMCSHV